MSSEESESPGVESRLESIEKSLKELLDLVRLVKSNPMVRRFLGLP